MFRQIHPRCAGSQGYLRLESKDILREMHHIRTRVQIDGHAAEKGRQNERKEACANKRRQLAIRGCPFAERITFEVECQRVAEHHYHRLIAHADLVRHTFIGCAGRAEDIGCFAFHGRCLQRSLIAAETADSGIGCHIFGSVTLTPVAKTVQRRGDEFKRIAHRARRRYHHHMFELLALKRCAYRLLQPVEYKSHTALAYHRIQSLRRNHQIRHVRRHTRHIGCQHDIDELRQRRTKQQQLIAFFETHSSDDAAPEIHLFLQGLTTDTASEID